MEVEKIARHVARAARLTDVDLRRVFAGNVLGLLGAAS